MASKLVSVDLDLSSASKILNVPTPTSSGDATPKGYIDTKLAGKITVATTAPGSPSVGDLWVDST